MNIKDHCLYFLIITSKKGILLSALIILFFSCTDIKSKKTHRFTQVICNDRLFREEFLIFGQGAFGGDLVSNYITDSINFRKFIDTFDYAHSKIFYKCVNDSIYIEKYAFEEIGIPYNTKEISKVVYKIKYSLSELRTQHKFE